MRWLDELLGGSKSDEGFKRLETRLEDLESLLREHDLRTEDKFSSVLNGLDTVMPKEKGHFINQLEEKLVRIKRDIVCEAVLSQCLDNPHSYPELKKIVKNSTGLHFSNAFLDSCIRNLTYERKIEKLGNGYVSIAKPQGVEEAKKEIELDPKIVFADAEVSEEIAESIETTSPVSPDSRNGITKLERLNTILNLVESLERKHGSVPVDLLLEEGKKCGIAESTCNQLLDEHLMITGQLYEPRQGHVKLVRATASPVLA